MVTQPRVKKRNRVEQLVTVKLHTSTRSQAQQTSKTLHLPHKTSVNYFTTFTSITPYHPLSPVPSYRRGIYGSVVSSREPRDREERFRNILLRHCSKSSSKFLYCYGVWILLHEDHIPRTYTIIRNAYNYRLISLLSVVTYARQKKITQACKQQNYSGSFERKHITEHNQHLKGYTSDNGDVEWAPQRKEK